MHPPAYSSNELEPTRPRSRMPILLLTIYAGACADGASVGPELDAANDIVALTNLEWRQLGAGIPGGGQYFPAVFDPARDVIYLGDFPDFGVGKIYSFSLRTHEYTKITTNNWPLGKFRALVLDPRRERLLTFWDGLGQVFELPLGGGSWAPIGTTPNSEEYYEGAAYFDPVASKLARFAGYGFFTFKNTRFHFNVETATWDLVPAAGPVPSGRFLVFAHTVDPDSRRLFIAGEERGALGFTDDLWSLDLITGNWTQLMAPGQTGYPWPASRLALNPRSGNLFRYGGVDPTGTSVQNDLYVASVSSLSAGFSRVIPLGPLPPPRIAGGLFYDQRRGQLIVVGGINWDSGLSDVWALTIR